MYSRDRTSLKPRPAARDDWEDYADETLKTLWTDSLRTGKSILKKPGSHTMEASGHVRSASEDNISIMKTIQSKTFQFKTKNRSNASRPASLPTRFRSTSQSNSDASLKQARRRIRLASDFDDMLQKGFPTLSPNQSPLTIYISLTPKLTILNPLQRSQTI
ncbi:hypothetical protein DSO57_1023409 [Entomophthora muscae]|uniref:Uncharacterized protein n=1 Tax=Entomophthora muscae TaxID=34485 RepID=A0ACC2U2B0_9FUNG|nr:hypothetical protein DSO57_1023409 [Entomophthora muscae]